MAVTTCHHRHNVSSGINFINEMIKMYIPLQLIMIIVIVVVVIIFIIIVVVVRSTVLGRRFASCTLLTNITSCLG